MQHTTRVNTDCLKNFRISRTNDEQFQNFEQKNIFNLYITKSLTNIVNVNSMQYMKSDIILKNYDIKHFEINILDLTIEISLENNLENKEL